MTVTTRPAAHASRTHRVVVSLIALAILALAVALGAAFGNLIAPDAPANAGIVDPAACSGSCPAPVIGGYEPGTDGQVGGSGSLGRVGGGVGGRVVQGGSLGGPQGH